MFSNFFAGIPKINLGARSSANPVTIPPIEVHDVETSTNKRDRRLKHLLKLNHANFSILYNHLRFHNHTPHLLGSAYLLGSTADHLTDIYENAANSEGHEPWVDAPSEIALHDYRDFLGKREYQRAWVDFFEDQLMDHSYDWKQVAARFLFERGPKGSDKAYPMFSCLTGGLGHPLIHLGYAYELSSREVGMEALGLAATCYDTKLASLLETAPPPASDEDGTSNSPTTDPLEIFRRVRKDTRLDGPFSKLGNDNLSRLLSTPEYTKILLSYFHAWSLPPTSSSESLTAAFEATQRLAITLLISTAATPPTSGYGYDFFLLHILTTSHALRVLLPFLPAEHHITLLREWWLITLALYIAQLRPDPDAANRAINDYDKEGKSWKDAEKLALEGEHKFDEHYVKGIRAIKEAAKAWAGDGKGKEDWFEKAAVKFAVEFEGWEGFSAEDEDEVKKDEKGRKRRGSHEGL